MQYMSAAAQTAALIPTSPPVKHIDNQVEPSTTENVPAGHHVHAKFAATLPDASLYVLVPAPHAAQDPPVVSVLPPQPELQLQAEKA